MPLGSYSELPIAMAPRARSPPATSASKSPAPAASSATTRSTSRTRAASVRCGSRPSRAGADAFASRPLTPPWVPKSPKSWRNDVVRAVDFGRPDIRQEFLCGFASLGETGALPARNPEPEAHILAEPLHVIRPPAVVEQAEVEPFGNVRLPPREIH